jgi:hypothetical protein
VTRDTDSVWLQDWERPRVRRRFELKTGRCLESKVLENDKPEENHFGVCSRCSGGFALVYRTTEGIRFQFGSARLGMDHREAIFYHERKLGGVLSELRIEPRDRELPTLLVKSFSIRNVISPFSDSFEQEFFHWVANSANDATWVAWISQRWQTVGAADAANPSAA